MTSTLTSSSFVSPQPASLLVSNVAISLHVPREIDLTQRYKPRAKLYDDFRIVLQDAQIYAMYTKKQKRQKMQIKDRPSPARPLFITYAKYRRHNTHKGFTPLSIAAMPKLKSSHPSLPTPSEAAPSLPCPGTTKPASRIICAKSDCFGNLSMLSTRY